VSFQQSDDPTPSIDLRTGVVSFSSLPRLVVGVVVAVAAVGALGWLVIGAAFDAPWYVAAPLSVFAGAGFVAWHVAGSWRGYAVSVLLWLVGLSWFAWWWVEQRA
jgi:hypothetical protein